MSAWQIPDYVVKIVREFIQIDPQVVFLGLTPGVDTLKHLLLNAGVSPSNFRVMEVAFDEINDYLVCGDIGLLLREDNPVNRYACPTKFAEYLAAGLHVLATSAIWDIRDIIKNNHVGTLISLTDSELDRKAGLKNALHQIDQNQKEKCVQTSKTLLDWELYIPKMKTVYLS